MDQSSKKQFKYTTEVIIISGYLIFFCLATTLWYVYYLNITKHELAPINAFAVNLPPTTPTPHISPTDQTKATKFFEDNFSDDSHGWSLAQNSRKVEVT